MTIKLDEDNITVSPTQIDNADSPYLTNGEQYIYVDTTNGPVTIQLASSDTVDGAEIRIIDTGESASTNTITIQTEGAENINPGSNNSITLTVDGTYVDLFSDGSNWFSDRAVEKTSGQISGLQSLSTKTLVTDRHYAGGFDGSSPDTRLDNALSAASEGDVVILENEIYSADRTLSTSYRFVGTHALYRGTSIDAIWTIQENTQLENIELRTTGGPLTIAASPVQLTKCGIGTDHTVSVEADGAVITSCQGAGEVTFASGTSGGLVDACVGISVTDNGTNTIGDIA
jgi:hypothetical protein